MHTDYVMAMALDGEVLITGGADGTISLVEVGWARRHSSKVDRDAAHASEGQSRSVAQATQDYFEAYDAMDEDIILGRSGGGGSSSDETRAAGAPPHATRLGDGRPRAMNGHRGQVNGVHAHGGVLASCSASGREVLLWSLGEEHLLRRHSSVGSVYAVRLDDRHVTCGGEGRHGAVRLYDWSSGELRLEPADNEPPLGVTTCLHRCDALLAAGNSDAHSQLRVWDVREPTAGPIDRFSLPPYVKGIR
jgi:WD40 repeat protein